MLTEDEWLSITQSFPTKPEQSQEDVKLSQNKVQQPLHQVTPKVSTTENVSEQKLITVIPAIQDQVSNEIQDSMHLKLKLLTTQVFNQNLKIEEQQLEIRNLVRKLTAATNISNLNDDIKLLDKENRPENEMILDRLDTLEQKLHVTLSKIEGYQQTFVASEVTQGKMKMGIKPKTNLAAKYRIAAVGGTTPSVTSTIGGNAHENEELGEKIQNLEKMVETLKSLMLKVIMKYYVKNKN